MTPCSVPIVQELGMKNWTIKHKDKNLQDMQNNIVLI
jgi:hypothetical protein